MNSEAFRQQAHKMVDWMADYMDTVEDYPVKSQVQPKEIYNQLETTMPVKGESMDVIFEDFKKIIIPGITHWQSPNFYAYFQANSSPPSILAEMLTATMGVQGMKWETSPASTELEERIVHWLLEVMGFPTGWDGVIQDSASSATLVAIITARELKTKYEVNQSGFDGSKKFRVYCSTQTHSSIEKAAKIAGIGKENVIKIGTNERLEMDYLLLSNQIEKDKIEGYQPLCIIAALGTTSTLSMDSIKDIAVIAERYEIWLHIDAAYSGSALLLPEYQHLIDGIDKADSFVFNPHKWLFTNFDCSIYFIKDKKALINTFSILPEYLKTQTDGQVNNHCDWGIPLGRRFRSLKLWFVLRYYGLNGLQEKIRLHNALAHWVEIQIENHESFELLIQRSMNLICFRYHPKEIIDPEVLNVINEKLLHELNATGKLYLTHTKINDTYAIRMSIGQTNVTHTHVKDSWKLITDIASTMVRTL
jgi:aromatic-L-amino-acid/L-tryptophan decarboxylase